MVKTPTVATGSAARRLQLCFHAHRGLMAAKCGKATAKIQGKALSVCQAYSEKDEKTKRYQKILCAEDEVVLLS